jgi:hypothetical protein
MFDYRNKILLYYNGTEAASNKSSLLLTQDLKDTKSTTIYNEYKNRKYLQMLW